MSSAAKVSVVLPTYNRASLIEETICSVLNQTYSNFELIIVDDGSSDNTQSIIDQYSTEKIRVFYQDHKGRSHARNLALKKATGDYITFIDSDDVYLPNKLQSQVEILERFQEYGMLYSGAYCIDQAGRLIPHIYNKQDLIDLYRQGKLTYEFIRKQPYLSIKSGDLYEDIAFYLPLTILLPTVMIRAEVVNVVGGFDLRLDRFEDVDYWRRISKHYKIYGSEIPTCKIRSHSGNLLENQDPLVILKNMTAYVEKVNNEDTDIDIKFRQRRTAELYCHYAGAILQCRSPTYVISRYSALFFIVYAAQNDPSYRHIMQLAEEFYLKLSQDMKELEQIRAKSLQRKSNMVQRIIEIPHHARMARFIYSRIRAFVLKTLKIFRG